jgi:hypothetical protein
VQWRLGVHTVTQKQLPFTAGLIVMQARTVSKMGAVKEMVKEMGVVSPKKFGAGTGL